MQDNEYFDAILSQIRVLNRNGESSALWPFYIPDREDAAQTARRKHKLTVFFKSIGCKVSPFVPTNEYVLGRMEEIYVDWSTADLGWPEPQ